MDEDMTDSNMSRIHRPEYEIIHDNPVIAPVKLCCLSKIQVFSLLDS